jgi:YD repeat-containing protein
MHGLPRPSFGRFLALLVLILVATPWPSGSQAQTVPSSCRPNGSYDCATYFPKPYTYLAGWCGGGTYSSEAAAFAVYRQQFAGFSCPISFSLEGWISPGAPKTSDIDFIIACAGYPGQYPVMWYGRDSTNWLLEEVTKETGPPPACGNPTESVWGAVRRERSFSCPEGYWWFTSDVCYRSAANLDYPKNYGTPCQDGQCQTRNPINIGAVNKFRAESDYRAGGNSPLAFTRYYNSFPQIASFSHHYRDTNFELYGLNAYASLGRSRARTADATTYWDSAPSGRLATRTSARSSAVSSILTSAYAYRQDGRVLAFTKKEGVWYTQADIKMRLAETVDGGGAQTGWQLTLEDESTETFDLAGRLTTLRSRAGIEQTLAYDSCGRLASVTVSFGKSLSFGYTTTCDAGVAVAEVISTLTVPGGGIYQYGYDSNGRLTSVTDPAGKVLQYH